MVQVKTFDEDKHLFMATRKGIVKKTTLAAFSNPRKVGINAINIGKGDELIEAKQTDGSQDIVLGTREGKAIRFHETDVRAMGRVAAGVKGISLGAKDQVIGMVVVRREGTLIVVSDKGYGKRSAISDYRVTGRGGKGIITLKETPKIGKMIAIKDVLDSDDLLLITANGIVIREKVEDIKVIGRNTQGVRLMRLAEDDKVADVARVVREEGKEDVGGKD